MEDIIKNWSEKISSYDILNNLFPGVIFCIIVEKATRISVSTGELWKDLFLYYFVGMILSRIGSIFDERILKSIKVTNKETKGKENFLQFAPYSDYIEASEANSIIKVLSETNNIYRTIIVILIAVMGARLYDCVLYDWISGCESLVRNLIFIIVCLLLISLFLHSYKKQTDYIRERVEKYVKSKQENR